MKEDLLKQMEAHKQAKQDLKKQDLEFFEVIKRQKDDIAKEEREKREAIQQKVLEQKLVRDQQISEHNRLKKLKSREKKEDYERLKQMERDLVEQKQKERDNQRSTKERVMENYMLQINSRGEESKNSAGYPTRQANENMLDSLFQEKRNISKEMMAANEKRIEAIMERMVVTGGLVSADDGGRARDFIQKTE
jgi:triphosphoribosyl-dephospho-CoA synthetase